MNRCLFFGCWNHAGHYLWAPGAHRFWDDAISRPGGGAHLDGSFAPKRDQRTGQIACGATSNDRDDYHRWRNFEECPQGQFLKHTVGGFTLIQWWDRNQGDGRGACNSTILLEGEHTSEEVLAAGKLHFPHVFENLERAGVALVEVFLEAP